MEQRGDEVRERFAELVSAHQVPLLRLCYTLLRSRELAEDAVQDTFLRVWQHRDQIGQTENVKAWIFRIGVNRCRDLRRSAWIRHMTGNVPEQQEDPSAGIPEDALMLNTMIQQLPFKQKEVILLYYYQRFTVEEIGAMLHISHSTVSGRLKRGLAGLAVQLEADPGDERRG